MARDRQRPPLPWLIPVVDAGVLLAGVAAWARDGGGASGRFAVFTAALVVLLALDVTTARLGSRPGARGWTPGVHAGLLVVRVLLFAVVVLVDDAGLSRLLFLLVPFQAWTAFGALPGLALGVATLVALPAWLMVVPTLDEPPTTDPTTDPDTTDLLMFVLGMVLTSTLAAMVSRERRLRERLEEAGTVIASLSAAAERQRLARDVHDSVGHHLTATAVQLDKAIALRELDPARADAAVAHARQAVGQALSEVREALGGLRDRERPTRAGDLLTLLRGAGLVLGGDDLAVGVRLVGADEPLDPRLVEAAHGVAREALTNVRRHAGARRAEVVVRVEDDRLVVTVEDDGHGFDASSQPGQGLRGMRERVEELGGELTVRGDVGGTAVTAWLPIGGRKGLASGVAVPT